MTSAIDLASAGVVGFRFHPTDEELVDHYMMLKMLGLDEVVSRIITEIDICKFEPRDLPGLSPINSENDTLWYFFCRPDYKYPNSKRFNRTTKEGSWKVTGKDRMIKGKRSKKVIGIKKTLVFHEHNKPKAIKTNWVIHEYHSKVTYPNQRDIILCRLKYKHDDITDISSSDEAEPSQQIIPYDLEDGEDDTIMGEAYGPRLAEKMAELQSLIELNHNSSQTSDELLRHMFNTLEPGNQNSIDISHEFFNTLEAANHNSIDISDEFFDTLEPANQNSCQISDELLFNTGRAQMSVNSFPLDQDAYSYEGATIFQDYSPSESSSRERVRSPRFTDYEVNYMVDPQGGLPPDTRTSKSQYRSQNVIAERYELKADFGDSSSKVTSRIQPREQVAPFKSQHEPKPIYQEAQSMSFQDFTSKAASKNKAKEAEGQGDTDDLKGSIVVDSSKSSKMAEGNNSRSLKSTKSPSPRALGRLGKNCFIVLEPSPLNLIQQPRSVYLFKLVIGIFLFLVFLRELIVLH